MSPESHTLHCSLKRAVQPPLKRWDFFSTGCRRLDVPSSVLSTTGHGENKTKQIKQIAHFLPHMCERSNGNVLKRHSTCHTDKGLEMMFPKALQRYLLVQFPKSSCSCEDTRALRAAGEVLVQRQRGKIMVLYPPENHLSQQQLITFLLERCPMQAAAFTAQWQLRQPHTKKSQEMQLSKSDGCAE